MSRDKNCISYWLPRLEAAGVPVPRTEILRWPGGKWTLMDLCDGKEPAGWPGFLSDLTAAAGRVGGGKFPVFLRTGQGSGKHSWRDTCFVADPLDLPGHVTALVEWSHLVDMLGLPHDVWAVREMLPVRPVAVLPRYGDFPLARELRCFVEGGEVVCRHDYWPDGAVRGGLPEDAADAFVDTCVEGSRLSAAEAAPALELASRVARAFAGDGAWSVDVLETDRGFYVTDMAVAGQSYHWESCPNRGRDWS